MAATMPIGKQLTKKHEQLINLQKKCAHAQAGFTYMGLLMIIAIAGIGMAGVGIIWHQESQREREKELLFIGEEYRKAIGSYYENSPSGAKQFPESLKDLVLDNRFPSAKRHIRQLYADPMATGKDWNVVLQQGKVIGLHSTSSMQPIKKSGFATQYETFGEAASYKDWLFTYTPGSIIASTPAAPVLNAPASDAPTNSVIEPTSSPPVTTESVSNSPFAASPFSSLPSAIEPAQ